MKTSLKTLFAIILFAQSASADVTVSGFTTEYWHTAQRFALPGDIDPFGNYSAGSEAIGHDTEIRRNATFPQGGATARSVISVGISSSSQTIRLAQFADVEGLFSLSYTVSAYFETDANSNYLYRYEPIQEFGGNDSNNGGVIMQTSLLQRVDPNGYIEIAQSLGPVVQGRLLSQFLLEPNSSFRFLINAGGNAVYDPQTGQLLARMSGSRSASALLTFGSLPTSDELVSIEGFSAKSVSPQTSPITTTSAATSSDLTDGVSEAGITLNAVTLPVGDIQLVFFTLSGLGPATIDWTFDGSLGTDAFTFNFSTGRYENTSSIGDIAGSFDYNGRIGFTAFGVPISQSVTSLGVVSVPEPSIFALLALGLGGIFVFTRKRLRGDRIS